MNSLIIIGGGVVGLSTAHYAAQRGWQVTVIDRGAATDENCSYGNAGLVVPSHFVPLAAPGMVALGLKWMRDPESPFHVKPRLEWDFLRWAWSFYRAATPAHVARCAPLLRDINLASRACYQEFAALPGLEFGFANKGLLMLCKSKARLDEEARMAAQARLLGLEAEVLDARQTAALDPGARLDIAGAVYFPGDCHLNPARFMAGLKSNLEQAGVQFRWSTEVLGWQTKRRRLEAVRTTAGELAGDEYILCAGSWSPRLVRDLDLRLPLQPGKGYSLTLPNPRQLPQIPAICSEARLAVTPMDGTLRFGGTMELAGLNLQVNPARVRGILKAVPQYYPDFILDDFRDVQPWVGLRPCSPDGLPYIGRTAYYQNLVIATGHAMMGLSLGPITGKLVTEILADEKPTLDLTAYSPDRYG